MCEMGMKCLDCGAELKAVRFRKALSPTDESLKLWDRIHSGERCGRPPAQGRPARRDHPGETVGITPCRVWPESGCRHCVDSPNANAEGEEMSLQV